MILEVGTLNVKPGEESAFEETLKEARPLIAATPGFHAINVHHCIETPNRYLLLVTWRRIKDVTLGRRWREACSLTDPSTQFCVRQ